MAKYTKKVNLDEKSKSQTGMQSGEIKLNTVKTKDGKILEENRLEYIELFIENFIELVKATFSENHPLSRYFYSQKDIWIKILHRITDFRSIKDLHVEDLKKYFSPKRYWDIFNKIKLTTGISLLSVMGLIFGLVGICLTIYSGHDIKDDFIKLSQEINYDENTEIFEKLNIYDLVVEANTKHFIAITNLNDSNQKYIKDKEDYEKSLNSFKSEIGKILYHEKQTEEVLRYLKELFDSEEINMISSEDIKKVFIKYVFPYCYNKNIRIEITQLALLNYYVEEFASESIDTYEESVSWIRKNKNIWNIIRCIPSWYLKHKSFMETVYKNIEEKGYYDPTTGKDSKYYRSTIDIIAGIEDDFYTSDIDYYLPTSYEKDGYKSRINIQELFKKLPKNMWKEFPVNLLSEVEL